MAEYIEREAFIERQQHIYCENCARRKDGKGKFVYDIGEAPCRACGIMDVIDAVEDYPAADVRPVVRGKWVNYGDEYCPDIKCCMCGQRKPILLGNFNFNFCPNCGADMRGEQDEKA